MRGPISIDTEEVAFRCYMGVDLHAKNGVAVIRDEASWVLYQNRLRKELSVIQSVIQPYRVTA
ncbi:MAG: hypothetical protein E8D40_00100 [Nitrospira sp.]|nr:MAG: hypothetical protein E8D40_00100 [Nitrospira sp.]